MIKEFDIGIVGSGILGIAHAYECLKMGLTVALFEKDSKPRGATVRNFGQIVPSGFGTKWQVYGRESVRTYKEIQGEIDISVTEGGSLYVASNEEEMTLLEELKEINTTNDYKSELWTANQCLERYKGLKDTYAIGGLFFPDEITIDPSHAASTIIQFLIVKYKLNYFPNQQIIECGRQGQKLAIRTASGTTHKISKVFLANGREYQTLFPQEFQKANIKLVKLQMLNTYPQQSLKIPGSLLTGHTIRRYECFHDCPSYKMITDNASQDSFYKEFGIHILFKQSPDGRVIVGDSHEYFNVSENNNGDIFNNVAINDFIIHEAKKIFELQDWRIERTWLGFYSQCVDSDIYETTIENDIHIVNAIGGKGMTASFGYAKENVSKIFA